MYWYGSGGEILAETNESGGVLNEYIYFGGKRVAVIPASGSPMYYAEDMLGSSRVMVRADGTVCYDADFTPFGAELPYTNSCPPNYKFEGKERDTETGNDEFGARYYSWRVGRWLSSDWSAVPVAVPYANLTNPQTLNLYAMVADDPESFADLDGHGATSVDGLNTDVTEDKQNARRVDGGQDPPKTGEADPIKVTQNANTLAPTMEFPTILSLPTLGEVMQAATVPLLVLDYLISPPSGSPNQEGTIQSHTPPSTSQEGQVNTGPTQSTKPSLSDHKDALRQVHDIVGKQPKGEQGKFGSPQRGTSEKGYRLDPGHPGATSFAERGPHINYWDWTGGKKGSGGIWGAIPIPPPSE